MYEVTQNTMKKGICLKHREFIEKMGEISKIRDYCSTNLKLCK